jgi:PhnB protein
VKQDKVKGEKKKMAKINPYLSFNGNAEAAVNFYKSVFGGEVTTLSRFRDAPSEVCEEAKLSERDLDKIMHAELPIGDGNVLMAHDVPLSMSENFKTGDGVSLSLNTDSREETDRLFAALSTGGSVTMPLADAFWGDYFGMCVDQFGVSWLLSCDRKQ